MRVLNLITTLGAGGAETMLFRLLTRLDRSVFEPVVVSLADSDITGRLLEEAGIAVHTAGLRRGIPHPRVLARVSALIARLRPDVIQTWMYHADLLGGIAGAAAGIPVVWNVRHGEPEAGGTRWTTRWVARACAVLSGRVPHRIVCCSEAARTAHERIGYRADRIVVIPNGFDPSEFRPDAAARAAIRSELGIGDDEVVIGSVARDDPAKDHATLLAAARLFTASGGRAHFVLCGAGVTADNPRLAAMVRAVGAAGRVHLLGQRRDVTRVMAAMDILTSSSRIEGFPNVVGEAMACGIPCVVTDVGDSAYLVGETGVVVPPRDPGALAGAWTSLLRRGTDSRAALGRAARERVSRMFSIESVVERYTELWLAVARAATGS